MPFILIIHFAALGISMLGKELNAVTLIYTHLMLQHSEQNLPVLLCDLRINKILTRVNIA